MTPDSETLFRITPLDDLQNLLNDGIKIGAQRLLLLAGQYPVYRIHRELSPAITNNQLHFEQTQQLARALLNNEQSELLDKDGAIEFTFQSRGIEYRINVFYGNGSHNIIVFYPE